MTSSSGLRGHRRTYLTILESTDHALFKMVGYVLLRPLRPELDVIQNNCRVKFVGISRYVHFRPAGLAVKGIRTNSTKRLAKLLYRFYFLTEKLKNLNQFVLFDRNCILDGKIVNFLCNGWGKV
jgi:hypothetical protein